MVTIIIIFWTLFLLFGFVIVYISGNNEDYKNARLLVFGIVTVHMISAVLFYVAIYKNAQVDCINNNVYYEKEYVDSGLKSIDSFYKRK